MCFKDSNYNWAATRQNLSLVCPTKLHSNQFTQLQRLARKMKAVAQSNYQTYLVTYVGSNCLIISLRWADDEGIVPIE